MSDLTPATMLFETDDADRGTNILLYGPPGTGKSVAACSAPGPILIVNAEGPGGLRFARRHHHATEIRSVQMRGRATLDDVARHLRRPDRDEQTVVIDTIGEVYEALLIEMGGVGGPTLQQYGDAARIIERFIRYLRDLPIVVVLIAHERLVEDGQTGEVTRGPVTGGNKLPAKVMAMMDVVAYTGVVTGDADTPDRWVGQVVAAAGRQCKDRSGRLGRHRDLDLTEWLRVMAATDDPLAPAEEVAA